LELANGLFADAIRSHKILLCLTAAICLILVFSAVTALTFMPPYSRTASSAQQTETPMVTETPTLNQQTLNPPQTPTESPHQGIDFSPGPIPSGPPSLTVTQPQTLPAGCINSSQALEIAMPYITQFTQQHNLIVIGYWVIFHDGSGNDFRSANHHPAWQVDTGFYRDPNNPYSYYLAGYSVELWADTGEVYITYANGIA
jgi:hypothetical protein